VLSSGFGKTLMVLGAVLLAVGAFMEYGGGLPFSLGRLPGDIHIEGEHGSFHFPVVTCIVISVLLNIILSFFR